MEVVIRADGGPDIGYGHLVRTSALANALREKGHRVTVATTTPESVANVYNGIHKVVKIQSRGKAAAFLDEMQHRSPEVVVTDAYPVDYSYQRSLRDRYPLAVIQDDARHPVCADLVVNGNVHATELDYDVRGKNPRWCFGPDFLLLRRVITELAQTRPPWRDVPERSIITLGGSDPTELTPTVMRAFDGVGIDLDVIVGPGFSNQQERDIHNTATAISTHVNILRDPEDLPERLFKSDFGICTSSTTTYEFLGLGTPIIAFPQVPNQEIIAESLADRNLGTILPKNPNPVAVREAVVEYMENARIRRNRRNRGRELIDCQGAPRVANAVESLGKE